MNAKRKKILSGLRGRAARALASSIPSGLKTEEFAVEIPGVSPDKPLWRLAVKVTTEPEGDGERLKMRLHWQSNPGGMLALAPPDRKDDKVHAGGSRLGGWLKTGLALPRVQQLAQPILRREFNSWMEVHASTADLDRGAGALLAESERLTSMGVVIPAGNAPLAQTWTTAAPGSASGFAQLSLVRLDKRHLPKALASLLGSRPFQLAAAIVNVVEEKPGER